VNDRCAGNTVGRSKIKGYPVVNLSGRVYQLHQIAVLWMTGSWPDGEVDHINHIRDDNRWSNLRVVSRRANVRNSSKPRNNTSGHIGVGWMRNRNKWRAQIGVNGKTYNLGHFDDIRDAIKARKAAESSFGFHPNHGS